MINGTALNAEQKNHIQHSLEESFKNIPDNLLKYFTNRAVEDTKTINQDVNSLEFKEIAYAIYRAYCIGYILKKQ